MWSFSPQYGTRSFIQGMAVYSPACLRDVAPPFTPGLFETPKSMHYCLSLEVQRFVMRKNTLAGCNVSYILQHLDSTVCWLTAGPCSQNSFYMDGYNTRWHIVWGQPNWSDCACACARVCVCVRVWGEVVNNEVCIILWLICFMLGSRGRHTERSNKTVPNRPVWISLRDA